jgi:hypothetical protein
MPDRHPHTVGGRSPVPDPIFPSRPCSPIGKPANDSQGKSRTRATAGSIAWLVTRRILMRFVTTIAPLMCDVAGSTLLESSARAETAARSAAVERFAIHRGGVRSLRRTGALDPCCDAG